MTTPDARRFRIFACGTLLPGERNHDLVVGARRLGAAKSAPHYALYDLGTASAMVENGTTEVVGELFEVDVETLAAIDIKMEHPVLFRRRTITLDDGSTAHGYLMTSEQVRGKRRNHDGAWRKPSGSPELHDAGPFVSWARSRFRNR